MWSVCVGALALVAVGCAEDLDAAVGAHDQLPARECVITRAEPAGAVALDHWPGGSEVYRAVAPGTAMVRCAGASYRIHVEAPAGARLAAPVSVRPGERFAATLELVGASGKPLAIGRYGEVAWTFGAPLGADNPGSCEFPPWCGSPPAGGSWVVAPSPGSGRIEAAFAGARATATVEVR